MKKILLLAGDGIGPEIMRQAVKVLNAIEKSFSWSHERESASIGGCAIDESRNPLPEHTLSLAKKADAILLAAVGGPKWDHLSMDARPEKGLLRIRSELKLFANLRPARVHPLLVGASSLKPELVSDLDMMIVRELTGGLYFGQPRRIEGEEGTRRGINTMVYDEQEIVRIATIAFEIAMKRNKRLCSVDKANVLEVSQLWREVVNKLSIKYPEVVLSHLYVDNAAMQLVKNPKQFDVIVTENLFGDILSDCAAMLTGSIGLLPSASLNAHNFGLYEPVHGSAPDIAGQDKANPLALLYSVAMMFRYSFNEQDIAQKIEQAIAKVVQEYRTGDMDTPAQLIGCEEMGDKVAHLLC